MKPPNTTNDVDIVKGMFCIQLLLFITPFPFMFAVNLIL